MSVLTTSWAPRLVCKLLFCYFTSCL